jgi:hypothetical protein
MKWAEHVTRMGEEECIDNFDVKARREDLDVGGRKILK